MIRSPALMAVGLSLALGGCQDTLSDTRMAGLSPASDFVGHVSSMAERRFAGVVRQQFDFSCGSAALATLLRHHYGEALDERAVFGGMWRTGDQAQIRRLGFSLLDMKRYLAERGFNANGFTVSINEVAKGGTPGIALINLNGYKHFVVIKGVRDGEVLVGDPSTGIEAYPLDRFAKLWNGVYFIIEPGTRPGSFNAATHWAGYTRSPVGNGFADPLSQQALALTAPFHRDF